jgi:ribonucleoside-triphosphate reductase
MKENLKEKYPVEVYSRVVGYLSPVSGWNKGKREELKDRVEYKL